MTTATETQELLSESACYACYGFSLEQILTLADLKRILLALDPSADTDVNSLLADNPCLDCYSNGTLFDIVEMALLAAIYNTSSAVGSFLTRAGITDATQIAALTQLYSDAVEHGWWEQCDVIYPFVGGTAQAHAQNLKSTNYTITWVGVVTHDSAGITGDGTTGYGMTNYVSSLSPIVTLNSGHLSVYRRTTGGIRNYFSVSVAGNRSQMSRGAVITSLNGQVNGATTANLVGVSALALSMWSRVDAAVVHGYSGLVDTAAASVSSAIPTLEHYLLALNADGVPTSFTAANLQGATAGSGMTFAQYAVMKEDWVTFQTILGRQI